MTTAILIFTIIVSITYLVLSSKIKKMQNERAIMIDYGFQTEQNIIVPNMSEELKRFIFSIPLFRCTDRTNRLASYTGLQEQIKTLERCGCSEGPIFYLFNDFGRLRIESQYVIIQNEMWCLDNNEH